MKVQYEAMQNLQESINCLNDEVEDQRLRSEELQQTLADTESRLKESIELVSLFFFSFFFCWFEEQFFRVETLIAPNTTPAVPARSRAAEKTCGRATAYGAGNASKSVLT